MTPRFGVRMQRMAFKPGPKGQGYETAAVAGCRVEGIEELQQQLRDIGESIERKHMRAATQIGGRIIIRAAKQTLSTRRRGRKSLGLSWQGRRFAGGKNLYRKGLAKSLIQRPSSQWPSAAKLAARGIVGTTVGFQWPVGAHAHLVEFGHKIVGHKSKRRKTEGLQRQISPGTSGRIAKEARQKIGGFVPPYPFFRPAVQSTQGAVKAAILERLRAGIREEAAKSMAKMRTRAAQKFARGFQRQINRQRVA